MQKQDESNKSTQENEEIRDYLEGCVHFTKILTVAAPVRMPKRQKDCIL